MKDFEGTPGTKSGFFLRFIQCLFAAASITHMVTIPKFFTISAFCFLVASMCLQAAWSLGLAFLDAYSLVNKKPLQSPHLISFFVIGDLVTAMLSLAGASSSAGIVVLMSYDSESCKKMESMCQSYITSVVLAFLSWISVAISSLIMVWILAAQ